MSEIGKYLRFLREQNGMRGAQAARDLGMSRSALHDLESGRVRTPTALTLAKFARLYGVSLEQLLHPPAERMPARVITLVTRARTLLEGLARQDARASEAHAVLGMALTVLDDNEGEDDESDHDTQTQSAV